MGLGSLGGRPEAGVEISFPFPFSLPFSEVEASRVSFSVRADEAGPCDATVGSVRVALFLTGLSNAFFIFLTLTCPNPGRFRSWSGLALDMFAKLFSCHVSTRLDIQSSDTYPK